MRVKVRARARARARVRARVRVRVRVSPCVTASHLESARRVLAPRVRGVVRAYRRVGHVGEGRELERGEVAPGRYGGDMEEIWWRYRMEEM